MRISQRIHHAVVAILGTGIFGLATFTSATPISYVKVTNDIDSGISTNNTYTHAIDFERTPVATTVNGVAFTSLSGSGGNFTHALSNGGGFHHDSGGVVTTSGDLAGLMQGFIFHNGALAGGLQTYTLSGLQAGTTYDLRIYTHSFSSEANRPNTLVFDVGGAEDSTGPINEDNATSVGLPGADDSYYINYRYTAASSNFVFTAESLSDNASWHLYGLSNQVAIPEPTMIGMLALGAGLLLFIRRRMA